VPPTIPPGDQPAEPRHPERLAGPASQAEEAALDEAFSDLTRGWRTQVDEILDIAAGNNQLIDGIFAQVRSLRLLVTPARVAGVAPIDIVHIVHAAAERIRDAVREAEVEAIGLIDLSAGDGDDGYTMDGAR
jgi:hypothetical protein